MGTPHYMAPEQMEQPAGRRPPGGHLFAGRGVLRDAHRRAAAGPVRPAVAKVQIDVRLDEVVLRALEKEPERRYQQASEVKTDVERVSREAHEPSSAKPFLERDLAELHPSDLGSVGARPAERQS